MNTIQVTCTYGVPVCKMSLMTIGIPCNIHVTSRMKARRNSWAATSTGTATAPLLRRYCLATGHGKVQSPDSKAMHGLLTEEEEEGRKARKQLLLLRIPYMLTLEFSFLAVERRARVVRS